MVVAILSNLSKHNNMSNQKLTKQQFLKQYGEAKVFFAYYYKYSFSFIGEFKGKKINISVGDDAENIYKIYVENNKEYKVKEFNISYGTVKENEVTIAEFTGEY